ncbi:MAG: hypothetical protein PHS93_08720 [Candidatus Omnitrophica bacterium]|nr:hypothetical protein [Candidatus Omnitrophota bacterium]
MREFRPINREVAKKFINEQHRHNVATVSDRFRIGLFEDGKLIGVGVAGNPIARKRMDGETIEITRVCVLPDKRNACSQIYSRMKRIAQLMGYKRIITYTLDNESGSSLRAIGAKIDHKVAKGTWLNRQNRKYQEVTDMPKQMWLL